MSKYLKIAYIGISIVLLYFIWDHLPHGDSDNLFDRLLEARLIGFVALMLIFYFIFLNYLRRRNKKDD